MERMTKEARTHERLDEIEALALAASEGPNYDVGNYDVGNAAFLATARRDVLELVALVRQLATRTSDARVRECADCGKPAHDEECAAQRRANRAAAPCYAHGGECAHGGEACELSECRPCLHPDAWPAELQARLSTRTTREDYLGVLKEGMDWQWRGRSGGDDPVPPPGEDARSISDGLGTVVVFGEVR